MTICHSQQRHILNRSFTIDGSAATNAIDETSRHAIVISNGPRSDSSRDSGTSSPQPNDAIIGRLLNGNSGSSLHTKMPIHVHPADLGSGTTKTTTDDDDDSDSTDSVISTSSSLDEDLLDKIYEPKDIYLGGSCALRTKWRRCVVKKLAKEQVTFYLPTLHENLSLKQIKRLQSNPDSDIKADQKDVRGDDIGSLMYNPRILDSSRVLLFVITNETRSLAPMTLAAHYIGRGYNVVLCIQMLPENCTIGNDKVRLQIYCAN